jgi:hypothetical protein
MKIQFGYAKIVQRFSNTFRDFWAACITYR